MASTPRTMQWIGMVVLVLGCVMLGLVVGQGVFGLTFDNPPVLPGAALIVVGAAVIVAGRRASSGATDSPTGKTTGRP